MKTKSPLFRIDRLLIAALALLAVSQVQAQTNIWTNPITGTSPGTNNPYTTGDSVASNLTVSGIGRGSGVAGSTANNRYAANSWNTASIDLTAYFTLTLTPSAGYEIDFGSFLWSFERSSTGPGNLALRSSIDSFDSNIWSTNTSSTSVLSVSNSLSSLSFQNITNGIEFRIYGWGASQSTGTLSVNDFQFTGNVNQLVSGGLNWSGGSGSWTNGFGSTVTNGSVLSFSGAGGIATNEVASLSIASITFSNGAGSYTNIQNAFKISNGIVNNSASQQVFSNAIALGAAQTFDSAAGGMTFAGNVDNGGFRLTVGGASNTVVSGAISGLGGLTKSGAGTATLSGANSYSGGTVVSAGRLVGDTTSLQGTITNNGSIVFNQSTNGAYGSVLSGTGTLIKIGASTLTLSGANDFTGATTISNGALRLSHATGAGTTAGTITVVNGAALELTGGIAVGAEALSLNGTGISSGGALRSISGNNSYAGAITLATGSSIATDADTFTITGGITGTGLSLTVQGAGNTTISTSGINTGASGTVTKTGTGTLTVSVASSYTGLTTISQGALRAAHNTALGTTGGGVTVANGAALELLGGITIGAEALNLSGTGISSGGALRNISGNNTYGGTITNTAAARISSDAGTLTLSGAINATNQALTFGGAGDIAVSGAITNSTSTLTKDGAGMLTLSGANTYSGGTLVSGGRLIGTTTSLQGSITNNAAATFDQTTNGTYAGAMTGSGSLVKSGAGVVTLSGANSYSGGTLVSAGDLVGTTTSLQGAITNNAAVTFNQAAAGTYAGAMSGTGSLTKSGAGTVTLSGANSYAGGTTVGGGAILASTSGALGSGAVEMSSGSTLAASGVTLTNNFTIGSAGGSEVYYSQNFNDLGTGLPTDWTTRTGANASGLGTSQAFSTTEIAWDNSSGAFKNFASATGLSSTSTSTQQNDSADRALGIRQTGAFANPGASFQYVFTTTGETIDAISFDLMMLSVQTQSTTWSIQYGVGAAPTSFTTLGTWSDPGTWGTTALTFDTGDFGSSLDNQANLVFRVVALSSSTGSGNRDSIAIDNFVINSISTPTGTGTLGISEAGSATFSGSVAVNSTATFTAAEGGLATFSGVVSGAGSALSKTGVGTVTLSGSTANTFTGTTTVSAGTLQLNKSTDVAAIAGNISVNSGAVLLLSSSGNIANSSAVTLSGGTITRGAGVNEAFSSLNLTTGSFLDFGTGATGSMTFGTYEENTTPSALLTINNFLPGNSFTFSNAQFAADGSNIVDYFTFGTGFQGRSINDLGGGSFTITAIPEPSTYLAAAGLLSLMLWPSRKRLLKDAKKILGITPPMRDRLAAQRQKA
jgi:fibronectin-binding autotransporter adhesin